MKSKLTTEYLIARNAADTVEYLVSYNKETNIATWTRHAADAKGFNTLRSVDAFAGPMIDNGRGPLYISER